MSFNARVLPAATLLVLFTAGISSALIEPITSVKAGKDGSPPYMLESVTVRDYTVTREFLATGTSSGSAFLGSSIKNADNFDLNDIASRNNSGTWRVTKIDNKATWRDSNGPNPDFFIFEAGMNDSFTVQAILPGGVLGEPVSIPAVWGDTGLRRVGLLNMNQRIGGIAFAVTDLLDLDGKPLTSKAVIEGIQINSGNVDPVNFSAVIPEPASLAILGLGGLLMIRLRCS